ncbi:MAG: hypothetical protein H6822_16435 [Planctomycetaceae bacterium]|nr:hypothetical protein [Planctomycetales bacterium]MCB9923770.1 hypothetical protein [Planctomycetaceae bacterium]
MAKLLALEWGQREARIAVARTQGASIVVEHAFGVDLGPRDPGQTFSDESIASKLAAALASRGVGRAEVLVAVGRANIELRQLALPPSPLEELPDLVRFQALRQFTTIGEDWPIDFVYLDTSEDNTFSVLAAAISPEMVTQISSTCQSANCAAPKRLVLRAFAAASLLRRHDQDAAQPCRLMVDLLADEADLTVMVDESVVLMRTVRLAFGEDGAVQTKALLGEVRRTIASAQNQLRGRRVEKVILCGDGSDQHTLKDEIEAALSLAVELFDPFSGIELDPTLRANRPANAGRFAPLLGMLMDEAAGATHPIDFLHPRKRPATPTQTKRNVLIAGVLAATLLLLAGGVYFKLSNMDAVLADLNDQSNSLKKDVETANQSIAQARSVEKFFANDITWLDELYAMAKDLPPPEDAIFTQIKMSTRQPSGAQIVLDGYTREAEQLSELRDALRVQDRSIISTGTSDDARRTDYNWRFSETVVLTKTISLENSENEPDAGPATPNEPLKPGGDDTSPTASRVQESVKQ